MAITILITDEDLNVIGDPISNWTSLDCTLKFNEPASGSITMPAYPGNISLLQPGNRIQIIRDGETWCAGPLELPQDYSWGIGDNGEPDPGRVTASFSDDLARIAGYITWPEPADPWSGQPAANTPRTITSTSAEDIIRTLVNENCGPGAIAARQIPNLALDADLGVGTTTSVTTTYEALLDVCRRVAIDGGHIGFRTRQDAGQIKFGCYASADLTATARFSKGLGNLRHVQFRLNAPTVTSALVAGGEETTRVYVEVSNAAAASDWWRVERFVEKSDAANDTNGELTQAGNEELASGAAPVELSTVTVDTEFLKAGRDFSLGDLVTVALPTGLEVANIVRSIHLQATPKSGEFVTSVVGSAEATTDPKFVQMIRELSRRLGRLEAK